MDSSIVLKAEKFVTEKFLNNLPKEYTYHNLEHTLNVVQAARDLSREASLSEEENEVLLLAAYFHDLGFLVNPEDHETYSAQFANDFLTENNYGSHRIQEVIKCIDATRMTWEGNEKLCLLLKDADLSGLASTDYKSINRNLRKEINALTENAISKKDWKKKNVQFLKNHKYLSEEGNRLYHEQKMKNLKKLTMDIDSKKKSKKPKFLTIGSSKSAQTQFKTALRNHIDLSSIADNKANIMLSVNAIIITVALPLLLTEIEDNPNLLIPTLILAAASLISMIFATLSTRPIAMKGKTNKEDIKAKKSNLFFFGNYYNMSFDEYEDNIRQVVADDDILDNSITRDLFFLGKSLGKKFEYLRWCYNVFMYGLVATVLSFLVVVLIWN
ncbi:MAG: HD domain-containing protein [Bacteroidia bacterium]|nr:HD domain-containing protein [Bacteroidia bacterium]